MGLKSIFNIAGAVLFLLGLAGTAGAQDILVKADGTGDYPTIQAAIDAAVNGDVVILEAGTYTGDGNRDCDFKGKAITVKGATGDANDVIIDCQGTSTDRHRGFEFVSGEDANSILEGLTITNGYYGGSGGGIFCLDYSSPTIQNCTITNNTAKDFGGGISCFAYSSPTILNCTIANNSVANYSGGGIFCSQSSPAIQNCTITNNVAHTVGGGVSCSNSSSTIQNCAITNNIASDGSGVYCSTGNPTIQSSTITGNTATHSGGGIYCDKSSPEIQNCTIMNNTANYSGGIRCSSSNPRIQNCTIASNTSHYYGGGIHCSDGVPTIQNCTITNNASNYYGGGIDCGYDGNPTILNCTIANNTANYGGGICCRYSIAKIQNCTITNNTADYGGGIYCSERSPTIQNCIIWNNLSSQIFGSNCKVSYSDIQGGFSGTGNINLDPLFETDGFHLSADSPCIDAGDPNYIADANERDIDNDPRFLGRIDIGADEFFPLDSAALYLPKEEFIFQTGKNSNVSSQILPINNYGAIPLNWHIEKDCGWLIVDPLAGQTGGLQTSGVMLTIANNIDYGTYSCNFEVVDPCAMNSPQTVTVNLEVLRPAIGLSNNNFVFSGSKEGVIPAQELVITNTGYDTLNWYIDMPADCNWLSVAPMSGIADGNCVVALAVDTNVAGYGQHSCQLQVIAPDAENSPQVVIINLEVLGPVIGLDKTNMYFTAYGKSDVNVASQELVISNSGYDTLNWHVEIPADCNWLTVNPAAGQVRDGNSIGVVVSVDPNKTPLYGYNYCTFNIVDDNASNSPAAVTARLDIKGPSIYLPQSLQIYAESNTIDEATFDIRNTGYDILHWQIEVPENCNWITAVEPSSGECIRNESDRVMIIVDANGLANGTYKTQLTITSPETSTRTLYLDMIVYTPNEIHVPADYPTIQAAINVAKTGDVIIVHPGKYGGFGIDSRKPALTIQSVEPENPAVVAATIIETSGYIGRSQIAIKGLTFIYNPAFFDSRFLSGLNIELNVKDVQIRNCSIFNFPGSGIYMYGENANIESCTINGNGYAGIASMGGWTNVNNCVISGNFGAGVYCSSGGRKFFSNVEICKSTMADNFSDSKTTGLGIQYNATLYPLSLVLQNCIVANSIEPNDSEIFVTENYSYLVDLGIGYSNILNGFAGISAPNDVTINWGAGNVDCDPCFVSRGYWDDNGTAEDANDDVWIEGDYHLKSAAGRWQRNELIDMDVQGNQFLDMCDFAVLAGEWGQTNAMRMVNGYPYLPYLRADLDNDGRVDIGDLAIFCKNYLSEYEQGQWVYDDVTSECIDAGDPNSDWTGELWPHGKRVNMGAYGGTVQASMSLSEAGNIADLDGDDAVDLFDLLEFANRWLVSDILIKEDLDLDGDVDFADFAIFAGNWMVDFD